MSKTELPENFEERIGAASGKILSTGKDGIPTARVPAADVLPLMKSLKAGPGARFLMLTDVFAVDEYPKEPRFDVIYHLSCLETGELVRIRVFAQGEKHEVPSVTSVYGTANWHEREAYDMMGITFAGHPDLKRILMPLEYEYYPLRKNFPLEGIEPERLFKDRFPDESIGSMHQKRKEEGPESP